MSAHKHAHAPAPDSGDPQPNYYEIMETAVRELYGFRLGHCHLAAAYPHRIRGPRRPFYNVPDETRITCREAPDQRGRDPTHARSYGLPYARAWCETRSTRLG